MPPDGRTAVGSDGRSAVGSDGRTVAGPAVGLRERKKQRTRAELQRHALRLFAAQGYAQTTVEQIAAAAEVSPSTFFRYFATKEDTVLTDFIDARVIDLIRTAPARLSPVAAMRWALARIREALAPEEMELEQRRNELIASVPELRRGLAEELQRPIALLAEALCARLGRPAGDPYCAAYAGAMVGGTLAVSALPSAADPDPFVRVSAALDTLEQVVRTPPRGASRPG